MNDRDDDLDRALAALPLDEPPPHLHARIMAATVYAPVPESSPAWEPWIVGVLVALAVWLGLAVAADPRLAQRTLVALVAELSSTQTLLWLAVGASAVFWVSLFSPPGGLRVRAR